MRGFLIHKRPVSSNKQLYLMFTIMSFLALFGVLCGALLTKTNISFSSDYITNFVKSYLENHKTGGFISLASFTFLYSMLLHLILLVLGFSCVGSIFILLIPFIKGIFVGCITGFLYSTGIHGIITNLIIFWFPQVFSVIVLIFFSTHAFNMSCGLFNEIVLKDKKCRDCSTKSYVKVFIFTGFLLLISALFESLLSGIFAPILI